MCVLMCICVYECKKSDSLNMPTYSLPESCDFWTSILCLIQKTGTAHGIENNEIDITTISPSKPATLQSRVK